MRYVLPGLLLLCMTSRAPAEEPIPVVETVRVETVRVETVPGWAQAMQPAGVDPDTDARTGELTARLLQIRRMHGPEASYARLSRRTAAEQTDTDIAAVSWRPRDRWGVTVAAERAAWRLDSDFDPNDRAVLAQADVRVFYDISQRLRVWLGGVPYGGSDGEGLGGRAGVTLQPIETVTLDMEGGAFLPWAENFYGVRADGIRHTLLTRLAVQPLPRLRLTAEGERTWYDAAGHPGRAGRSDRVSLRAESRVWDRPGWSVMDGFRTPRQDGEDGVETNLTVYGALERERYRMDADFDAVPVTPRTKDMRLGLAGALSISPHWGVTLDGYVGQDHDRSIAWGRLYGLDSRLLIAPTGRVRVWLHYGMLSSSGSALAAGREETWGAGVNVNF